MAFSLRGVAVGESEAVRDSVGGGDSVTKEGAVVVVVGVGEEERVVLAGVVRREVVEGAVVPLKEKGGREK